VGRAGAPNTFGVRRTNAAPPNPIPLAAGSLRLLLALMDHASSPSVIGRLGDPRRLAGVLLLGLTGGIMLAFLYARGELAGAEPLEEALRPFGLRVAGHQLVEPG
jgi:hypothetical protein